jgi:hypothetical protein
MTRKIVVSYPTPYGKRTTAACFPDSEEPDACFLGPEAVGLMFGIHDPHQLSLFIAEFGKISITPGYIARRGGHPVPIFELPLPRKALGTRLALLTDIVPVTQHYELVLNARCWPERAAHLGELLQYNLDRDAGAAECAFGLMVLNTGALEELRENEIDCLEAAVYYLLSDHAEWRLAASLWLKPFVKTWLNDWLSDRSYIRFVARSLRAIHNDDNLDLLVQTHGC